MTKMATRNQQTKEHQKTFDDWANDHPTIFDAWMHEQENNGQEDYHWSEKDQREFEEVCPDFDPSEIPTAEDILEINRFIENLFWVDLFESCKHETTVMTVLIAMFVKMNRG